jgi:hypothetical protein
MIADDQRNRTVKLPSLMPMEKIRKAVKVLGRKDRNPGDIGHQVQAPLHL